MGPFATEAMAREQGFSAYPSGCKVYMLDTVDGARAARELKAIDIKEGRSVDEALRYSQNKGTLKRGA